MAAITIKDLDHRQALDRGAMTSIRGGGASWVFGWIRPYTPGADRIGPSVNFIQVNNFYADQMINQIQVIDVRNTAPNSNINVSPDEHAANRQFAVPA